MSGKCGYNCADHPTKVRFDPDITGTGVLISYVASAGVAVIIITAYYFLAYCPDLNPFRPSNGAVDPGLTSDVSFKPNPVDLMILRVARRVPKHSPKIPKTNSWTRLDQPFMKCVLAMSDLQIVTGLAILISGYAQLPCGLSSYHWLIVGRLAWFSSLTHLSCLTLLRNRLHNHPAERHWRLVSMFIMVVMLTTAIVPTGNYNWVADLSEGPSRSDYAICYFSALDTIADGFATATMILLLLSINFGFLFRVVKLIQPLSNLLVGRPRAFLSNHVQKLLWKLYHWSEGPTQRWRIMSKGCYFAALALFLSVRVILDHWSSMFFEVYWLVSSFLYGLFSLLANLNIFESDRELNSMDSDNSGWSFGQVMAIVLLAAPLKTIVEYLYPAEQESAPRCDNLTTPRNGWLQADAGPEASIYDAAEIVRTEGSSAFKPDYDYYRGSTALTVSTTYIMLAEGGFGLFVICMAAVHMSILTILKVFQANFGILLLCLWLIIFFSLMIDLAAWKKEKKRLHSVLQSFNIMIFIGVAVWSLLMTSSGPSM